VSEHSALTDITQFWRKENRLKCYKENNPTVSKLMDRHIETLQEELKVVIIQKTIRRLIQRLSKEVIPKGE
jgi:hypothetical protein